MELPRERSALVSDRVRASGCLEDVTLPNGLGRKPLSCSPSMRLAVALAPEHIVDPVLLGGVVVPLPLLTWHDAYLPPAAHQGRAALHDPDSQ